MNPFITHPRQQGITYWEHLKFATGIAIRLLRSVIVFSVHAIFPFVSISRSLDLEATISFILERNQWIESAKPYQQPVPAPAHSGYEVGGIFASKM